jgi:CBS domain-containing protein
LRALANQQVLSATPARDLEEALHFLMTIKLRNNLRQSTLGQPVGNLLQPDNLSTLERDQLTNALAIVKQFRRYLQMHYRLEA